MEIICKPFILDRHNKSGGGGYFTKSLFGGPESDGKMDSMGSNVLEK